MSLPSGTRDKISNKVSLVTRPSATSVQPFQVIGTSASQPQPKLIYSTVVQSIQPSSHSQQTQYQHHHQHKQQHPTYFSTAPTNKPKPISQQSVQISIISSKTIRPPTVNKVVQLPSASISPAATINRVQPTITQNTQIVSPLSQPSSSSTAATTKTTTAAAVSVPNRVQTIHFKSNVPSAVIHPKTTIVNPVASISRPNLNDKPPATVPVTANTTRPALPIIPPPKSSSSVTAATVASSLKHTETIIQKLYPISSASSNHKTNATTVNVVKVDPVKNRYRTILENLLQLKVWNENADTRKF